MTSKKNRDVNFYVNAKSDLLHILTPSPTQDKT